MHEAENLLNSLDLDETGLSPRIYSSIRPRVFPPSNRRVVATLDRRCQASQGDLKYALDACNLNSAVYFPANASLSLLTGILSFLPFGSLSPSII